MRIMIFLIGLLTILAGVLPLLFHLSLAPEFFAFQEPGYRFVIMAVGVIGLLYGLLNHSLMPLEKFATLTLSLLTIVGGFIPFLQNFLTLPFPTSGPIYAIIIVSIGLVGLAYSFASY